jgi:hypothetical protein
MTDLRGTKEQQLIRTDTVARPVGHLGNQADGYRAVRGRTASTRPAAPQEHAHRRDHGVREIRNPQRDHRESRGLP